MVSYSAGAEPSSFSSGCGSGLSSDESSAVFLSLEIVTLLTPFIDFILGISDIPAVTVKAFVSAVQRLLSVKSASQRREPISAMILS